MKEFYKETSRYPTREQINDISEQSGKTYDQIRRWFEKQRHKDRRSDVPLEEKFVGDNNVDDFTGSDGIGPQRIPTPEERAAYLLVIKTFYDDVTKWPNDEQISDLSAETGRTPDQLKRLFYKMRHAAYRKSGLVNSPKPAPPSREEHDPRKEFFEKVTRYPTKEQLLEMGEKTGHTEEQLRKWFYRVRYRLKMESTAVSLAANGDEERPSVHPPEVLTVLEKVRNSAGNDPPTEQQVEALATDSGLSVEQVREWFEAVRGEVQHASSSALGDLRGMRHPREAIEVFVQNFNEVTKYPTSDTLVEISSKTGRTVDQVRKWFERRRFRDKKILACSKEKRGQKVRLTCFHLTFLCIDFAVVPLLN